MKGCVDVLNSVATFPSAPYNISESISDLCVSICWNLKKAHCSVHKTVIIKLNETFKLLFTSKLDGVGLFIQRHHTCQYGGTHKIIKRKRH